MASVKWRHPGEAELSGVSWSWHFISDTQWQHSPLHNYQFEMQWPNAVLHLWSLSHQKLTWASCATVYNVCFTCKVSFATLVFRVSGLLVLVLVPLSISLPSQPQAKSNTSYLKPSHSSQNKNNQLSKEKEQWMGNKDTWVEAPVQQIIKWPEAHVFMFFTVFQLPCL